MKLLKFGGTSVGSPETIRVATEIVTSTPHCAGVVVSAFSGVTDDLLALARLASQGDEKFREILANLEARHLQAIEDLVPENRKTEIREQTKALLNELERLLDGVAVVQECSLRTGDHILSFGERLSAPIFAEALIARGIPAKPVDTRRLIRTDDTFGCAVVDYPTTNTLIQQQLGSPGPIPVITGFIAATPGGVTTTLGRGGSDFTAAIVGAALDVDEIEIWTDVDGVMTADPRLVPTAMPIPQMSYEEAMELSHFGGKIIYPPTIQPALEKEITIRIRNTMNPTFAGTVIARKPGGGSQAATAISSIAEIALLRVQGSGMQGVTGIAGRVFTALAQQGINVILITQASSEHTICCAVLPGQASAAARAIEKEFAREISLHLVEPVVVEQGLTILSVVGERMRHLPGISGRFFHALGINGVNVVAIAQGSSELNISVVISARDRKKALNAVHDAFFLSDLRTSNLFVVGDGVIGSALLKQIQEHKPALRERYHLDVRVVGLTNTRTMGFSPEGLNVCSTEEIPADLQEKASLDCFIDLMLAMNLPHCVLVDCTASDVVPAAYQKAIHANVSIVTCNKRSLSRTMADYEKLKEVERKRGVRFLYETCVGAGLPIIGTLKDLLKSGDEIVQVEAVLSGTLSTLFNTYGDGVTFAETLRKVQEMGYTEPDPRDDLSGMDVARKLLILAREIGWNLEFEDIQVEDLCPASCKSASSLEAFYEALAGQESVFEEKLKEARSSGGKLCYMGVLKNGQARTGLGIVMPDHPFFSLSGSDNIVAFTTARYATRPLVVKGPGAGPEVTAAGVFADIIRVVQ